MSVGLIDKLLILQEKDIQIRQMSKELKDIPARKKEEESRLDGHRGAVAEAKEALKAKQAGLKKSEGDAEALREKIRKLRQQQMELKTNKEFKTMEEEIKGVEAQILKLEDNELVAMDEIEKAKGDVTAKEKDLQKEEGVVHADIKVLDERMARIAEELKGVEGLRSIAAQDLDARWLKQYNRIFAAKDRALVPLEEGICGGCHMKLPPAVVHAARKQTDMVTCDYCGRLLYLAPI